MVFLFSSSTLSKLIIFFHNKKNENDVIYFSFRCCCCWNKLNKSYGHNNLSLFPKWTKKTFTITFFSLNSCINNYWNDYVVNIFFSFQRKIFLSGLILITLSEIDEWKKPVLSHYLSFIHPHFVCFIINHHSNLFKKNNNYNYDDDNYMYKIFFFSSIFFFF